MAAYQDAQNSDNEVNVLPCGVAVFSPGQNQSGNYQARAVEDKQQLLNYLQDDLNSEYKAIDSYGQHMASTQNPHVRQIYRHIIRDEQDHVNSLTNLIQTIPRWGPGLGNRMYMSSRRLGYWLRSRQGQGFALGVGAAAAAAYVGPMILRGLRPVAVRAVQGLLNVTDRAAATLSGTREKLEDLVAEARYNQETNITFGPGQLNEVQPENVNEPPQGENNQTMS